jgi:hypothetical protein
MMTPAPTILKRLEPNRSAHAPKPEVAQAVLEEKLKDLGVDSVPSSMGEEFASRVLTAPHPTVGTPTQALDQLVSDHQASCRPAE